MDRSLLVKFWNNAWSEGLWAASWRQSVEGLTAQQAAQHPAPQRHSIWQIVSHIIFWREVQLRRLQSGQEPTKDELSRLNFPEPVDTTEIAWKETLNRLEATQGRVAATLGDDRMDAERIAILLPHDCYHFGQINYVRALLGFKPIE